MSEFFPKVSIIIPVYNGSNFLREAIESACSQTYRNIEVIVVNDGSNDNGQTEIIALSYGNRIRYFFKDNGGVASALNFGISQMSGDYFSWLSHDDCYYPDKIQAQIKFLKHNDVRLCCVYSNFEYIDSSSKHVRYYRIGRLWKNSLFAVFSGQINGCTLLVPRQLLLDHGCFNEKLPTTQDYDLWYKILKFSTVFHISEVLVKSRIHDAQDSRKASHITEREQLYLNIINDLAGYDFKNISIFPFLVVTAFALHLRRMRLFKAERYLKQLFFGYRSYIIYYILLSCFVVRSFIKRIIKEIFS